jgi:hypothetical protein
MGTEYGNISYGKIVIWEYFIWEYNGIEWGVYGEWDLIIFNGIQWDFMRLP